MAKRTAHPIRVALFLALLFVPAALSADSAEAGRPAPPFELRTIDGSATVSSGELFSAHRHVFLVFWSAGCSHCVEGLGGAEAFHRRAGEAEVAVVGVNADDRSSLDLERTLATAGVTFPQLRDPGAAVSDEYGAPFEVFTLAHVVSGELVAVWRDPQGKIDAALEEMLLEDGAPRESALPAADTTVAQSRGEGRIVVHARERLRTMIVDTKDPTAKGLYGEPVSAGRTVLQRLEAEGTVALTEHLRAGALLRISNEDDAVLEAGPEYYGSRWGSAFAEVTSRRLSLRLGYYPIHMTPLTLMRWDWDDSPRIGGDAGCGCGPAAGAILFKSLEELGPDLTFEGALATVSNVRVAGGGVEARAFYGMPRREVETEYVAYRSGAGPYAAYSLEIGGAEAAWQRRDGRTGGFFRVAARALATFENRRSVDFLALGYTGAPPSTTTALFGCSVEIPVLASVRLRGEVVPRNRMTKHEVLTMDGFIDLETHSSAGVGGFVFEPSARHLVQADYVKLDEDYAAPFAALSYEPDMDGLRVSAREWLVPDLIALSVFYRRLHEVKTSRALSPYGRAQSSLGGVSIDVGGPRGWAGGAGWLDKHEWRLEDPSRTYDARRLALVGYLSRGFESYGSVRIEYQRVGTGGSILEDPYADIWSLEAAIRF